MIRKLDLEQRRTHCGALAPELLSFRLDGPTEYDLGLVLLLALGAAVIIFVVWPYL